MGPGTMLGERMTTAWTGTGGKEGCGPPGRGAGKRAGGSSQGAGGQVRVFMLELPVQSEAPLLSVVGQEWGQCVDLAKG